MNRKTERKELVDHLIASGYLSTPRVIDAMLNVKRHIFVPQNQSRYAYSDRPLSIGSKQTISAPHMVAIMTEHLDVRVDDKILEIGAGSGYQAAILAEIAKKGKIYTVERLSEIAERARSSIKECGYKNISIIVGDGTKGYKAEAPYDRIIVTAGAPKIPQSLVDQLEDWGKLLIPVGGRSYQELMLVEKRDKKIIESGLGGCVFVPLIGEEGW